MIFGVSIKKNKCNYSNLCNIIQCEANTQQCVMCINKSGLYTKLTAALYRLLPWLRGRMLRLSNGGLAVTSSIPTAHKLFFNIFFYTLLVVLGPCRVRLGAVLVTFYPRDAMLARVIAIATCLSVRPSVCLSVCHAPVLCQNEES